MCVHVCTCTHIMTYTHIRVYVYVLCLLPGTKALHALVNFNGSLRRAATKTAVFKALLGSTAFGISGTPRGRRAESERRTFQ